MSTAEAARPPGRRPVQVHGVLTASAPAGVAAAAATTSAPAPEASIRTVLPPAYGGVLPRGDNSSLMHKSVSQVTGPPSDNACVADSSIDVARNRAAAAAAAVSAMTLRELRRRLNEGTVPRTPHPSAAAQTSAVRHKGTTQLLLLGCGGRSPLARAGMAASTTKAAPSTSGTDAGPARESVQVLGEASLHKTWAAKFNDTATLRDTVSTNTEAYTAFEEELVREVNELRRAPAAYAAIVEREATVGAPYVHESDLFFGDESAAESAAAELRRQLEEQYCPARGEATSAVPRGSAHLVSPKAGLLTGHEKRRGKKGFTGSPSLPALATAVGAGSAVQQRSSRLPPASEWQSTHTVGSHGGCGLPSRRETLSPEFPGGGVTVAGASVASATPATLRSNGLHELTLSQLRHQFRCQQRYRTALEVALRDMRVAQQQAETAQMAVWASEDEKALKKGRRFVAPNTCSPSMSPSSGFFSSNNAVESGVSTMVPHSSKKLSYSSTNSSLIHTSAASDDPVAQRRSEDMAQLRRMHDARIQHMEQELRDVCNACQRSLAAANIVLDAVRVLREAQPAPLVQHHRGLSLAARDTAETYYGDEERVAALRDLYAVSRATLVGLAEYTGAATAPLSTLEQLSRRLGECQAEEERAQITCASGSCGRQNRIDGDEGEARERSGRGAVPSWVLPLLSEEASFLANVTKNACATYGYISGEVRGLHMQAMAGSSRSLLLQMIIGSLTPVLGFSNHSLPQNDGQATQMMSVTKTAHIAHATHCYAGVRIEGRLYAAAGAPVGTSDTAARTHVSQFSVTSSQQEVEEHGSASEVLTVRSSEEGTPFESTEYKSIHGGTGSAAVMSRAQRAAAAAAQRLWPLLWAGAYTIGCRWQRVCGWRHVPTFAEVCEERQATARVSSTVSRKGTQSPFAEESHAAICTTLLFASGFEEYEVVRGCRHMSPAAAQRVVQSTPAAIHDSGPQSAIHNGSIADAVEARRAAVDVHSTLGVTLLTPTMHPIHIHASEPSCRTVCVAVRVPHTSPGRSITHSPMRASEDGRMCSGGHHDPSIRIVAQVTPQYEPTPPHPTTCAAEVLSQQSRVDPSVWLVLVDTAAAFQRHAAASTGGSSTVLEADGLHGTGAMTKSAASAALPLALHIYAKDMNDPMGEFEHVAFIRMQQYPQPVEARSGAVATAAAVASSTHMPSVLMAPEWRFLLDGLACMAAPPLSTQAASAPAATAHTAAQTSVQSGASPTTPTAASTGWATLHEPLLGRDGVLLCPLSADLRESERSGDVPEALRIFHQTSAGEAVAPAGRVMCVAVQLPANCNERWWRRRLSTLRHLQRKLTEEVAAEGDEKAAASTAQPPRADGTLQDRLPQSPVETVNLPLTEFAGPSGEACAGTTDTAVGASDPSRETATAVAASTSTPFSSHSSTSAGRTDAGAGAAAEGSLSAAEVTSVPSKGTAAEREKVRSDGKRAAKKCNAPDVAGGGGERPRGSFSHANDVTAGTSKKKAPVLQRENGSMMASSATALGVSATTGSLSAVTQAHRHTLSLNVLPELPKSDALREYKAMTERAAVAKLVASRRGSVQACLQPSVISIIDLRELTGRLHTDLNVCEAYLTRVRPILAGERDRIAAEINRKKGRELLRLQHDHEDLVSALQLVETGVASLRQAATAASNALRTRERTQVLRRARLARIADELSAIESSSPTFALKGENGNTGTAQSQSMPPPSAAPNVTLRFFSTAAVAAGSGCNAAFFSVARPQRRLPSRRTGVLDGTRREGADTLAETAAGEVVLVRQPSFAHGAGLSSPPSPRLEGDEASNSAVDVYAVTCSIPLAFTGRAALYIDDEVAVTWLV
ncbi:hypothetical protein JIQ42_04181 [Leishmania sp. Namibia]|uniref:hypothetical protein n=1 Tax=Leishmania sp. Namibia TaxID=2802991 RepID=UPI001B41AE39|nr:hypothetical protein JIQ42_04181 [Leishmania sp. Namibia]